MAITLKRTLAGLALIAAFTAAGCSSGASHPVKSQHSSAPGGSGNQIPQNNGGDHDGDNNGGPSDGDGNL